MQAFFDYVAGHWLYLMLTISLTIMGVCEYFRRIFVRAYRGFPRRPTTPKSEGTRITPKAVKSPMRFELQGKQGTVFGMVMRVVGTMIELRSPFSGGTPITYVCYVPNVRVAWAMGAGDMIAATGHVDRVRPTPDETGYVVELSNCTLHRPSFWTWLRFRVYAKLGPRLGRLYVSWLRAA